MNHIYFSSIAGVRALWNACCHKITTGILISWSALVPVLAVSSPSLPPVLNTNIHVETLLSDLNHPWSMAFLPEQDGILLTEKTGHLRLWTPRSGLSQPIKGLPAVYTQGQGGLMDVAIDPDFIRNHRVYLSFSELDTATGKAGTAVGYGVLNQTTLQNFKVIFRQEPKLSVGHHFGSSMVFDHKGHLFISLGENNQRLAAQSLSGLQGKIVRINRDGSVPPDNPFIHRHDIQPAIWAYGVRNPQGMAINPWTNALWETEHGPKGGDEINIIQPGKNYGWPVATYGKDYSGSPIPESQGGVAAGTEQPIYYWEKSPAVSGMAFYRHARFPQWQNSLFIGALAQQAVIRLTLDGQKVTHEEWLLSSLHARIRNVSVGPDGYVYVLTDDQHGQLLRISPIAQ